MEQVGKRMSAASRANNGKNGGESHGEIAVQRARVHHAPLSKGQREIGRILDWHLQAEEDVH